MAEPVTFLFLHDPQPENNDDYGRLARLSTVNSSLNVIDRVLWPNDERLSVDVRDTAIGRPSFIIFGGDMCQTGGSYSAMDQAFRNPSTYIGGPVLQGVRWLFDKHWDGSGHSFPELVRTNIDKVYFGLGNHDIQSEYHPVVWWLGYGFAPQGSQDDFWRYQMWDFICQMHTGLKGPAGMFADCTPSFPITGSIDDGIGSGSYDWKAHSFNYHLNLGFFSIFQMHRYGGDSEYGRSDGLGWFKAQLSYLGTTHPIIIVQHYPFDLQGIVQPIWTQIQADAFLDIIQDYNIVALLTAHIHSPSLSTKDAAVPTNNPNVVFDQFRPGMCSREDMNDYGGKFSIIRMSHDSFNIAHGIAPTDPRNDSIRWFDAFSKVIDAAAIWSFKPDNGNSDTDCFGPFGTDGEPGNPYIDLDEVLCPEGMLVAGVGLYPRLNRCALKLFCTTPAFQSYQEVTTAIKWDGPGDSFCDYLTYCDTNSVTCPEGKVVVGLRLYHYDNRFGVALKWGDPDGTTTESNWVYGIKMDNPNYFQSEDGVEGLYTDTSTVGCKKDYIVTGFALRKNGNRVAPMVRLQKPLSP